MTGGSRGIGAACVAALHRDGYRIALHYRRDEKLARRLCRDMPGALPFQGDLAETGVCENLVGKVKAQMGRVDVLVNNAGIVKDQILPFAKLDDFTELIAVNLKPVFILSKLVAKMMIRNKSGGHIINITSVLGHTGNFSQSMYAATKSAVTGFTKSIAQDLAQFNIMCNCVAPGLIRSEMTDRLTAEVQEKIMALIPLKKFGMPQDIARAVSFLASSSYITGATLHVNGGMYTN